MSLLSLLVAIVIFALILWLINALIPMDGRLKQILNIIVAIILILWLLSALGAFTGLRDVRI